METVIFRLQSPAGAGVWGAGLLVAYPNRTYRTGFTDQDGDCSFELYRTDQEMLVLGAAKGHLPLHEAVTPGNSSTIQLTMTPGKNGQMSVLFPRSTGCIPGIEGQLNPVNDGRTYLYADNIAVNGRPANPTTFEIGETLHLVDVNGMETDIRFVIVTARFSLIEYSRPRPYGSWQGT